MGVILSEPAAGWRLCAFARRQKGGDGRTATIHGPADSEGAKTTLMTKTIDESRSGRSRAHERLTPENAVLWPDFADIVYQASLDDDGIRQTMTAESHRE